MPPRHYNYGAGQILLNINLKFRNPEQEKYFWHRNRNGQFDGAFANGKSYVGCQRAFVHLMTFSNYCMAICRQEYKVLRSTTMKTFFKICPQELIYRHDEQQGLTILINKSFVYWMHLDDYDEQDLRGLEINSGLIDQGEEIVEPIYNVLDSRIGRWDQAKVPFWLLRSQLSGEDFELSKKIEFDNPNNLTLLEDFIAKQTLWPRHKEWGHFLVPNYMDVLCNVADDEEFHWTYRYYNPESSERKPDHFYIHREMDESLNDSRTYQQMLLRDQEWVDKYVKGLRGKSSAVIHRVNQASIISPEDYTDEDWTKFTNTLLTKSALFRILDHGETGVTCCLWCAVINNCHIFYREYYVSSTLISDNRKHITELSFNETYTENFADPDIFKKHQQQISGTKSGFWTVADEYLDTDEIDAPPIAWAAADNNEFATRNRINELLLLTPKFFHPITRVVPAPGIYFIKKSNKWPLGCYEAIKQIKAQRRVILGEDNGKRIYSEERDPKIIDHAYDPIRYHVAMHNSNTLITSRPVPRMSLKYYDNVLKRRPKFVPGSVHQ